MLMLCHLVDLTNVTNQSQPAHWRSPWAVVQALFVAVEL